MNELERLLQSVQIPRMYRVRQKFNADKLGDAAGELDRLLQAKDVCSAIKPGDKVAITVGSRGISNMPLLVRRVVTHIKDRGGIPFLVPAMGSHGGATAEGQKQLAVDLGYGEEYIGAPIVSDMDAVEIGRTESGLAVYFDKNAWNADWTIVMNRIKPHTSFRNRIESGLEKMMVIGLGKQKGAEEAHRRGVAALGKTIEEIAAVVMEKANILCAIGVLENAFHETCKIAVLKPDEVPEQEAALLEEAKALCPRLYFPVLDVLIVEEIGKEIAGTGMDPNVIGRFTTPYCSGGPDIDKIAVLNLTAASHGNGYGLGLADYTTKKVFDQFDFMTTYPNSLTNGVTLPVKIPMVLQNDEQAIKTAVKCCHGPAGAVRLVKIKNTLALQDIEISEALKADAERCPHVEIIGGPYELAFDREGQLV